MHNVSHMIEGTTLVIKVDLSKKALDTAPPSSSGKTKLVGTTGGAVSVAQIPGVSFALNVMKKA